MEKTISFTGEHEGTVDAKSRIVLPAVYKKRMMESGRDSFIARKDLYESCLVLYPEDVWNKMQRHINESTNPFNKEDRDLKRKINKNVFEVLISENGRMLFPKRYLDMANISKNVKIAGQVEYIEIWDIEAYNNLDDESAEFSENLNKKLGSKVE